MYSVLFDLRQHDRMWLRGRALWATLLLCRSGVLLMTVNYKSCSVLWFLSATLLFASVSIAGPGSDSEPKAPATSSAKPRATRIAVSIDETEMSLTIPPAGPAFVGDERWSHMLAIVAKDQTADGVTLHVAAIPKAADRAKVTNDQVVQSAKLKQRLTPKRDLVIEPGRGIERDVFGSAPPKRVIVRWVTK